MKIQTKIIILLGFITATMIIGVVALRFGDLHSARVLLAQRNADEEAAFEKTLQFQFHSLDLFAGDYSNWDEMLHFVQTRDPQWSKENIEEVIGKFNSQAAWVFTKDIHLVYSLNLTGDTSIRLSPVPVDTLKEILTRKSFNHFFIQSAAGLLEISTAPIQPSSDNDRVTPPQGYFVVARWWTPSYLHEVSGVSDKNVRWVTGDPPDEEDFTETLSTTVVIRRPLYDWSSNTVGYLEATQELKTLKEVIRLANFQFVLVVIFAVVILLPLSFFMMFMVTRPLSHISKSLDHQDVSWVRSLTSEKSEFGEISRLIQRFLEQRERLMEEIESHKRTEQALEKSERDYRGLFDHAHDPILVVGRDSGTILTANRRACETYGHSFEEFVGMPFKKLWREESQYVHLFDLTESKGLLRGLEVVHRSKEGQTILFEINAARIDYREQSALLIIERDITERKVSEELHLSHAILQKVGNLILVANDQGMIIYANKASEMILGYEPSELLGMGWWNLTREDPEERSRELLEISEAARGDRPVSDTGYEKRIRKKDGSECWIYWHDFKGSEGMLIGVGYDVTERKRAEEALIQSEKHYRMLFEDIPIPVWVFDTETLKFLAVNEAAISHYGYTRDEFLEMTIKQIRPEEDIPLLMENVEQEKDVDQKRKEWRHRKKDGELIDVEVTTHRLMFGDRPARLVLVDDITERKKKEFMELRLRMQKTRLAAVIDTQEEERRRVAKELHDGLGQVLSAIKRKLEYVRGLVSHQEVEREYEETLSMINAAMVETRRMSHNLIPNVLEDFGLFEAIERLCHQSFDKTPVRVQFQTFNFEARLPATAELSIYRIVQEAFQNIVKHADASEVSLQIVGHPDKMVLIIEDNGKGFDMLSVKQRPANAKGVGILSMRERIEFLNGSFHIYSMPGRGTTLLFEIPLEGQMHGDD